MRKISGAARGQRLLNKIDVKGIWPPGDDNFFRKLFVATHKRVKMVCEKCGSEDVLIDAWARWDVERQDWVLDDTQDYCYCSDCSGECGIEEAPTTNPAGEKK